MSELRYNPFLDTYTIVAANRQYRPHLPKENCPFCPAEGKLPPYDILVYPNDFPALSFNAPSFDPPNSSFFVKKQAYGACEVILYSPHHELRFCQLPVNQIFKICNLWKERFNFYQNDPQIKYIYPFENNGEEVGVTIHHPHGQLYAYSWIPPKIRTELDNCFKYYQTHHQPLIKVWLEHEKQENLRIVYENDHFIALIPFFTDYPYGVQIVDKLLTPNIGEMNENQLFSLALALKYVTFAFDKIFDRPFPYMLCVHQTPVNDEHYKLAAQYYSFHIEFYPPLREKDKIKWYASSEMGAGAATNTKYVEETAIHLRKIIQNLKF
jgi:UDPglucose--hexose-1-phosphate uridylyltransferase